MAAAIRTHTGLLFMTIFSSLKQPTMKSVRCFWCGQKVGGSPVGVYWLEYFIVQKHSTDGNVEMFYISECVVRKSLIKTSAHSNADQNTCSNCIIPFTSYVGLNQAKYLPSTKCAVFTNQVAYLRKYTKHNFTFC